MRRIIAVCLLACGFALVARAADADGPYVMPAAKGWEAWYVDAAADGPRKRAVPVAAGGTVAVAAVGSLPAFGVTLRTPAAVAPDAVKLPAKAPLFVVADTHGEFEIFAQMLRSHRVLGPKLEWRFGRGHLVVLGDVFDRGPNQVEILWLLYALEEQARRAGGGVHFVLGNHETMVLRGDLRYLHAKYRETTAALGVDAYPRLFAADTLLGQWLRTRATVLKVGEELCLHGGISRELLERGFALAEINGTVRAALTDPEAMPPAQRERAEFLFGPDGPLWYRGYFPSRTGGADAPLASLADVERVLLDFDVGRVLVGHTSVPTITPLYGGKVIAVQVYPRRDASGHTDFQALLVKDGTPLRALPDGTSQPF